MQLEQKGYFFCVLLIYNITITLPPVGSEQMDGTQTKTSGRRREGMVSPTSTDGGFELRENPRQTKREWINISPNPEREVCSEGIITPVFRGNFYIAGQIESNALNVGYQSDSAVSGQGRIRGQRVSGSEEVWKRMQPVVECGDHAMTLTVRRRRAAQLVLDRVNDSSVALSQLPPECGYSVQTTWRDLSLMAQYDACHVTQEDDRYVLPLLWRGTPVKMSCPAPQIQSQAMDLPSVCCSSYGMTVKVQGHSASEVLRVNVRGEWTPLVVLVERCGYTVERRDAKVIIAAIFLTCGITVKDGKYTLSLQIGDKTFTLSCPLSPPEELPLPHQPLGNDPHPLTRGPTDQIPASLEPFPWAPPFYLAPPYYPHPTYRHKYPSQGGHDAYKPPTPSSSTPDPIFGPQPFPSIDSQRDDQVPVREPYKHLGVHSSLSSTDDLEDSSKDLQRKQETPISVFPEKRSATHSSDSDSSIHAEAPPLQPPSHAFSQYYHYYHHPKIPLPDTRQDPDPSPEVPSSTNPLSFESSDLPPSTQQSLRLNSNQLFQAVPEAAPQPYTLPTTASYLPQPYPFHLFSYLPHIPWEAKSLTPLNPDMTANDQQITNSGTKVDSVPHSADVHDKYSLNLYIDQPSSDENTQRYSPYGIKHPLLSEDGVKEELEPLGPEAVSVPSPDQPSFAPPSPNHYLPPYPYYYHPYYHYYHMAYGPESTLITDSRVSPTSSKEALDPLVQASSSPPQHPSHHTSPTTTPPTRSLYGFHLGPLHPYYYYYYYHLYYQPEVSADNQEVHPEGNMNTKSESQLPSDSDYSQMLVHAAEAGHPIMPQSGSFHSLYPRDVTHHHPYNPVGHSDGEERLDNDLTDCVTGHHFIFAVPDSVVEPAVPSPDHPTEDSNVSCTLQRLTSDPDIYIVPLDGCGVNKHMFCQTVAHLLDVYGIHSIQQDYENSPVRLMVECSFPPGSPDDVRLQVMDQPPPPPVQPPPPPVQPTSATVTVQLSVATDESFTSFHSEAHLPLGFIRGRPVYVEVSLLDPPEPDLVLLVHSCLAYTQAPLTSWVLVYDGCSSQGDSQLLPSPHTDHIRRIIISSFLSLSSESPTYMADGGYSNLDDPEVFFLCLIEVCSAADADCTVGCINSPNSDV